VRPFHAEAKFSWLEKSFLGWLCFNFANEAQNQAPDLDTSNNICIIRDKIFDYSAALISIIDRLITSKSIRCDGPSSDDFSLSDAIRDFSRDVPWTV